MNIFEAIRIAKEFRKKFIDLPTWQVVIVLVVIAIMLTISGCATTRPLTPQEEKNFHDEFNRMHPIPNIPLPQLPPIK